MDHKICSPITKTTEKIGPRNFFKRTVINKIESESESDIKKRERVRASERVREDEEDEEEEEGKKIKGLVCLWVEFFVALGDLEPVTHYSAT